MEVIFINERTGEREQVGRSAPWIDCYPPYTRGEIFAEGAGWRLRVWYPSTDHDTYLSETLFETQEHAEDYLGFCRSIGEILENIMRSGG